MLFDIVIPTLDIAKASATVANLQSYSEWANNYIVIDNGDYAQGYVKPCNQGARAGSCDWVLFINDDVKVSTIGWDSILHDEAQKGTYCFGPWTEKEDSMRLNGWFLGLRRDYINAWGWAFDPRFVVYCGDIDLLMRLEKDCIEPVLVEGITIDHIYSATTCLPELQEWVVPQQLRDLDVFKEKWNVDANVAKVRK